MKKLLYFTVFTAVFLFTNLLLTRGRDDLLKSFAYPFVPLLFKKPSTGKIILTFLRYL